MAVSDDFNSTNSIFGDVHKKTFGIIDPPVIEYDKVALFPRIG